MVRKFKRENVADENPKDMSDYEWFNAVNYTELIPILITAVQEQQKEIEKLKTALNKR